MSQMSADLVRNVININTEYHNELQEVVYIVYDAISLKCTSWFIQSALYFFFQLYYITFWSIDIIVIDLAVILMFVMKHN